MEDRYTFLQKNKYKIKILFLIYIIFLYLYFMRCVFNQASYDRSDAKSKSSTISLIEKLIKKGHINEVKIKENPDKYGIDLLVLDKVTEEVIGYIEVEQSYKWGREPYPYKTIRLPERKEKWLKAENLPYGDKQVLFVMINNDFTKAALYIDKIAKSAPKKEVQNYRTGIEIMREIDIKNVHLCDIE